MHCHRLPHKDTVTRLFMDEKTLTCQQDCDTGEKRLASELFVPLAPSSPLFSHMVTYLKLLVN